MKVRRWVSLVVPIAIGAQADFSGAATLQEELDANRALWTAVGSTDYDYLMQRVCFCVEEFVEPGIVSVRGELIDSVANPAGGPVSDENTFLTIGELFDVVQDAIEREADVIDVEYDATLGFPAEIWIDFSPDVFDEEVGYVARLVTLDPGPPTAGDLATQREAWDARGLSDYDFLFQRSCFCPPELTLPGVVSVRGGVIDSVSRTDVLGAGFPDPDDYLTIDAIYDAIQSSLDEGHAVVDIRYDPDLAYPAETWLDPSEQVGDDEVFYRARLLVAVPEPSSRNLVLGTLGSLLATSMRARASRRLVKAGTVGRTGPPDPRRARPRCP